MAARRSTTARPASTPAPHAGEDAVAALVARLERLGSKRVRTDMAERYGIRTPKAFGVPVGAIRKIARELMASSGGPDHGLAEALWRAEWYEARMLACFVDDPGALTVAQMDRWCADFDNWGICDTACFHLFDRTPLAWGRIKKWSTRAPEFEKRAAFALLASVALHDKATDDDRFTESLALIEPAAADDRNFVKKAVSWALRRWVGTDALRQLASDATKRRVARKTAASKST